MERGKIRKDGGSKWGGCKRKERIRERKEERKKNEVGWVKVRKMSQKIKKGEG